jgi:hypothetical protein
VANVPSQVQALPGSEPAGFRIFACAGGCSPALGILKAGAYFVSRAGVDVVYQAGERIVLCGGVAYCHGIAERGRSLEGCRDGAYCWGE